jgi:hypothetical protein
MEIVHILFIIFFIFLAYFAFLYFTQYSNKIDNLAGNTQEGMHIIQPSIPAVMPPTHHQKTHVESTEYEEEEPVDPYANEQELADIPERMRKPERMFQPAPENNGMPVNSGIMGTPHSGVGGYASEMVQNEGEFMPGIFAFDKDDSHAFSMF